MDVQHNETHKKDIVLFVDDEVNILKSIQRGFIDENFEMCFARSAGEALAKLSEKPVSVIVSDIRMPDMDGLELLSIVREKYPDIVRLILTGYAQILTIIAAINKGHVYSYIRKPWKLEEEFLPIIRQSIEFSHIIRDKKKMISELQEQNSILLKQHNEILQLRESERRLSKINRVLNNQLKDEIAPFFKKLNILAELASKNNEIEVRELTDYINNKTIKILKHMQQIEFWENEKAKLEEDTESI